MWATLALSALTLAPAQAGNLELKNVRITNGILGQERKDTKLLPGDIFVVAYDIEGLKVKDDGRVRYSMGMELVQKEKDKVAFKRDPEDKEALLHLGGTSLPSYATAVIGTDTPPGTYVMTVAVTDLEAKQTKKLVKTFEVSKPELGFVRVAFSHGPVPAPPVAVPGQTLLLNFTLVGFQIDKKTNQPDLSIEMRILDADGKPTLTKPFSGKIKMVGKEFQTFLPFDPLPIEINKPGKYKAVLKAVDEVTKKETEFTLNLLVLDPDKLK